MVINLDSKTDYINHVNNLDMIQLNDYKKAI